MLEIIDSKPIYKNFSSEYDFQLKDGDHIIAFYDANTQMVVKHTVLTPYQTLSFKGINELIASNIYCGIQMTGVFVGHIENEDLIIKMTFDGEFLTDMVVNAFRGLAYPENPEMVDAYKEKFKEIIQPYVTNKDFFTYNMLKEYFVFDRSNLFRFLRGKPGSMALDRMEFLVNFFNRIPIDLTYGEIKSLIDKNCTNSKIVVKVLAEYQMPLAKFRKVITDRADDTLTVFQLKQILSNYQRILQGKTKPGQKLGLKEKLTLSMKHSYNEIKR
jgi:hypothetical protein